MRFNKRYIIKITAKIFNGNHVILLIKRRHTWKKIFDNPIIIYLSEQLTGGIT